LLLLSGLEAVILYRCSLMDLAALFASVFTDQPLGCHRGPLIVHCIDLGIRAIMHWMGFEGVFALSPQGQALLCPRMRPLIGAYINLLAMVIMLSVGVGDLCARSTACTTGLAPCLEKAARSLSPFNSSKCMHIVRPFQISYPLQL